MSEPVLIALVTALATFLAASAPKWIEQLGGARKQRDDAAAAIRDELRKTLAIHEDRIEELEKERDAWRDRYYGLRERLVEMQNKYSAIVLVLRANSLDHLVANIQAPLELGTGEPSQSKDAPPTKEA